MIKVLRAILAAWMFLAVAPSADASFGGAFAPAATNPNMPSAAGQGGSYAYTGAGAINQNSRALLFSDNCVPIKSQPIILTTALDAENYFGSTGSCANIGSLATEFFAGAPAGSQLAVFRVNSGRARIFGANVSGALAAIQSLCGNPSPCGSSGSPALSIAYRGYTTTVTSLDLYQDGSITSLSGVLTAVDTALDANIPQLATISSASTTYTTCIVTGQIAAQIMTVTAVSSNCILVGGAATVASPAFDETIYAQYTGAGGCGPVGTVGCPAGGVGQYGVSFAPASDPTIPAGATITERFSVLTIGASATITGTIATGQCIMDGSVTGGGGDPYCVNGGSNMPATTFITGVADGGASSCTAAACQGRQFVLSEETSVATEAMQTTASDWDTTYESLNAGNPGGTTATIRFYVEQDPVDIDAGSSVGYATGAAASALGWAASNAGAWGSGGCLTCATISRSGGQNSYPPVYMATLLSLYFSNFAQVQSSFDPDWGLYPATQKALYTAQSANGGGAGPPYQYIDLYSDTTPPMSAGLVTPSAQACSTPSGAGTLYTSSTTISASGCLRVSIAAIGAGGNSTNGTTSAGGYAGGSGGYAQLLNWTINAGLNALTLQIGGAGSQTDSTVTISSPVGTTTGGPAGGYTYLTGTFDAGAGGNASSSASGTAGSNTSSATAPGATPTSFAGAAGGTHGTHTGGTGGSSAASATNAGKAGGAPTSTGGSGGGGTDAVGSGTATAAGGNGGQGLPVSGGPTGGTGATANSGAAGGNGGAASSSQDGAGGGGGSGISSASASAGAGGVGSAGALDFAALLCTGGAGGGGGGGNSLAGAGANGGAAGANGASGGAGGGSAGSTLGVAGASSGGAICVYQSN
jgi:hypothetical protein